LGLRLLGWGFTTGEAYCTGREVTTTTTSTPLATATFINRNRPLAIPVISIAVVRFRPFRLRSPCGFGRGRAPAVRSIPTPSAVFNHGGVAGAYSSMPWGPPALSFTRRRRFSRWRSPCGEFNRRNSKQQPRTPLHSRWSSALFLRLTLQLWCRPGSTLHHLHVPAEKRPASLPGRSNHNETTVTEILPKPPLGKKTHLSARDEEFQTDSTASGSFRSIRKSTASWQDALMAGMVRLHLCRENCPFPMPLVAGMAYGFRFRPNRRARNPTCESARTNYGYCALSGLWLRKVTRAAFARRRSKPPQCSPRKERWSE